MLWHGKAGMTTNQLFPHSIALHPSHLQTKLFLAHYTHQPNHCTNVPTNPRLAKLKRQTRQKLACTCTNLPAGMQYTQPRGSGLDCWCYCPGLWSCLSCHRLVVPLLVDPLPSAEGALQRPRCAVGERAAGKGTPSSQSAPTSVRHLHLTLRH